MFSKSKRRSTIFGSKFNVISKDCGNKEAYAVKSSVPNFVKDYASLTTSTIELERAMPIKTSSLKASMNGTVTPSPRKRSHSNAFHTPRRTVVNVTNLLSRSIDDVFDNYFESTEMMKIILSIRRRDCPRINHTSNINIR